jgi:hypothetical protein
VAGKMSESWIAQSSEFLCQIFLAMTFFSGQRKSCSACFEEFHYSSRKLSANTAPTGLHVGKYRLR